MSLVPATYRVYFNAVFGTAPVTVEFKRSGIDPLCVIAIDVPSAEAAARKWLRKLEHDRKFPELARLHFQSVERGLDIDIIADEVTN